MSDLFDSMDAAHTAVSNVHDMSALLSDLANAAGPKANPAITAQGLATLAGYQCDQCNAALQALRSVQSVLFGPPAAPVTS